MSCDDFMNEWSQLYTDIRNALSQPTWNLFEHLSLMVQFNIIMGIEYPLTDDELTMHISLVYKQNVPFEILPSFDFVSVFVT